MSEDRQLHLPSKDCARYAVCSHGRGLSIMCPHCPPDARLCPKCASLIKPGDDFCSNCYDKAVGARREPQLQYTCANGHTAPTLQCKACYPWIDDGTCDCTVSANCGDAKCMVDNGVVPRDEDTEAELQPPDKDSSASCEGLSYPRTSFDGTGNGDKPGVFQPPAPAIQPSFEPKHHGAMPNCEGYVSASTFCTCYIGHLRQLNDSLNSENGNLLLLLQSIGRLLREADIV